MATTLNMIDRTGAAALIPEQVSQSIIKDATKESLFLQLGSRMPDMTSKQLRIPVATGLATASFLSGDTAQARDKAQKPTTNVTWDNVYITAEEIAVMVPVPEAVLNDSNYDIWGEVRPLIAQAFGKAIDAAVFFGTGKPSTFPAGLVPGAISAGNVVQYDGSTKNLYAAIMGESGVIAKVEESGIAVNGYVGALPLRARLRGCVDANKQPIFRVGYSNAAGTTATTYDLEGHPIHFMENGAWSSTNGELLLAGNFDYAKYAIRQDITYKIFDQGVITDGTGKVALSLMENDCVALRAVMRLGWALPKPVNAISGTTYYPFSVLEYQTAAQGGT